jgi:hypothetical protein
MPPDSSQASKYRRPGARPARRTTGPASASPANEAGNPGTGLPFGGTLRTAMPRVRYS